MRGEACRLRVPRGEVLLLREGPAGRQDWLLAYYGGLHRVQFFFTSPWLIPNYHIKNEKKTVSCIDGADLRQDAINCTKRHRRKKKVQHQFISLRYYYDKKIKCTQKTGTNCPLTMSRRGAKYSVQFI